MATAAALLSAAGCGSGTDPPAGLVEMAPQAANNDISFAAVIFGTAFRPRYRFDAMSGNADVDVNGFSAMLSAGASSAQGEVQVPLSGVVWEAESMLQASIPAYVPAGTYDLVVHDPRGQSSRLSAAFDSLGPDLTPPVVTISSPPDDSVVGAGAAVPVVVQVDDGMGQVVSLQVNVRTDTAPILPYTCNPASQAKTACTFSFVAPPPSSSAAVLYIDATAIDGGGNTATAETVLELVPAPLATSLSPASGSSLGGTSVTVLGEKFLAGATNVLFGGVPVQITDQSTTSLSVVTPPHLAGAVDVTVEVGGDPVSVPGGFLYVDPPTVRGISPTYGPVTGGTAVKVVGDNFTQATQILIGQGTLTGSTFRNANLIEGLTPAATGTGSAPVGAFEPVLDAQTYGTVTFNYGADGGVPPLPDGGLSIPCLRDSACSESIP